MRMRSDARSTDHEAGNRGGVEGEHDAHTVAQRSCPEAIAASSA
jgi:hypothetical protein